MESLRSQIASGVKVTKPSDSPDGAAKILRMNESLSQSDSYKSNIQNGLAFIKETESSLESMQNEVVDIMTQMANLKNTTEDQNLGSYADKIDLALKSIMDSANSEYDGKYLFGGTDYSSAPVGYSSDGSKVEIKPADVSGSNIIKVSGNIYQKINITGSELFATILKNNGNLDSSSAVGSIANSSSTIYDAKGNSYTLNQTFTKTAANTYSMTYDVLDSTSTSVFSSPPSAKTVKFDPASNVISTIDGKEPSAFRVNVASKGIDFQININSLTEKNQASSITSSLNQKNDIFNTLIQIRDNLRAGIRPTSDQEQIVSDFNKHILDKAAIAGDTYNQLTNTDDLLTSQQTVTKTLLSNVQDVDTVQALMDLQNQDNSLQMSYKVSSMILPKSLLDYL
jgi:flagellar hook-associated protein 3